MAAKKPKTTKHDYEMPSTSGCNKKGGPIFLSDEDDTDSDFILTDDDETCCVCDRWQPKEMNTMGIEFVKWGKCDFCSHWTHLSFCTLVKFLRRDSVFRCPHCIEC